MGLARFSTGYKNGSCRYGEGGIQKTIMPKGKTVVTKYIPKNMFDEITYDGIPGGYCDTFVDGMSYMLELIDNAKPADVMEKRTSYWTVKDDEIVCAKCKKRAVANRQNVTMLTDFCPNCGSKMVGG